MECSVSCASHAKNKSEGCAMGRGPNEKIASEKAKFLGSAKAFVRETSRVLRKEDLFPKRARWQYCYRIMDETTRFYAKASYANAIDVKTRELMIERYNAATEAIALLAAIDALMTVAAEEFETNVDPLSNWADLLVETRERLIGARSADLRRYEKHFGSLGADGIREAAST